ncbi:MAG: ABC transporter substrate-binding protein [Clostridia bacterium]|nr:ABC transporter substrate-binding protein [Clostridia bacterium]
MKRYLSIALALILIIAAFGGASASQAPVEVEFWYGLGGATGEIVQQTIAEFNAMQDDYVVIGVTKGSYTETFQEIQAPIAAGNPPALAILEYSQVSTLASKNVLEDLTGYIENSDYNKDDIVPAFYNQGVYGDKVYALPLQGTTQVFYYNRNLFDAAGIENPDELLSSWEGTLEASKKLVEAGYGGWMPMWGRYNLIDIAYANGGQLLSEDGRTVMINSPEWIEAWQFIGDAIQDGYMSIHSGGQGWEYWYSTIDDVMLGRAGGYTGSAGDQGDLDFSYIVAHTQPENGLNGKGGAAVVEATQLVVLAGASAEAKQGAFDFLTYLTDTAHTAHWSIATGYIAVRLSAQEDPEYAAYAEANPQILVPLNQAATIGAPYVLDPTGNEIYDALNYACDLVEIEGIDAAEALEEATEEAQRALDRYWRSVEE